MIKYNLYKMLLDIVATTRVFWANQGISQPRVRKNL